MVIYVDMPLKQIHRDMLHNKATGETFIFKDDLSGEIEQLNALLRADIVLGNPKPIEWLQQAANLKWIQLYSTGFADYSNISTPAIITNMQDYYSQPCAETMIAGIMALYRKMNTFTLLMDKKKWVGHTIRPDLQLLEHKKVIILGAGNIARRIYKILQGFDAEVIFFGRTSGDAILRSKNDLMQQIFWADIIIGCLPGTRETKGLFTKEMIGQMKPDAIFCNVGRGDLIEDEGALIDALMNYKIGGAVLDVTVSEPIPFDSRLWECPNTVLSQHSGGGQIREYEGIIELFLENLKSYKRGMPLKNQIEFQREY